ncbi:unnamed protein product, partial [Ectocarpus sp. 8 AP-2014]
LFQSIETHCKRQLAAVSLAASRPLRPALQPTRTPRRGSTSGSTGYKGKDARLPMVLSGVAKAVPRPTTKHARPQTPHRTGPCRYQGDMTPSRGARPLASYSGRAAPSTCRWLLAMLVSLVVGAARGFLFNPTAGGGGGELKRAAGRGGYSSSSCAAGQIAMSVRVVLNVGC